VGSEVDTVALIIATLVVALATAVVLAMRVRRDRVDASRLTLAIAEGQHLPPSLHPVIDPNICIGSLSCVKACPEGDILGLVQGRAELIEGSHCIGHSKCAIECPVDAIKLVFGTHEKGIDLPETDEHFESAKKGIFIIGELGGMGLIKNALRQGVDVGYHLTKTLAGRGSPDPSVVDVAIVGAGPSGLACALALKEKGLSFRLLEQDTVGGTVAHYPRNKVVMTEQVVLPFVGPFGRSLLSKEELIAGFEHALVHSEVTVDEGVKVESITGEFGNFRLQTSKGTVGARAVVLAIGLRGTPRKLGVPGEDLEKVTYRLIDPAQYDGQRVLVVGGGDSAVEAAIQLATESTARVTISYRQDSFSRAKLRNRELIQELIDKGRVRGLLKSQVKKVDERIVLLELDDKRMAELKNDAIIASLGGELPTDFLKKAGVTIKRYKGEEKRAKNQKSNVGFQATDNRRLAWALSIFGIALTVGLWVVGEGYYGLDDDLREAHALHEWLRPAGLWGHGVGVAATLFMLSNFIYVLRKRWTPLKGKSHIRTWLTFHMFVGIMSPVVIAFHAAFQSRNHLATATWGSLAIVVGTGVFGRFLFGLVPSKEGKLQSLLEIERQYADARTKVTEHIEESTNGIAARDALGEVTRPLESSGLAGAILALVRRRWRARRALKSVRQYFPEPEGYRIFSQQIDAMLTLRFQASLYDRLKAIFRVWLVFHVVLAVFMVVLITGHTALSLYLGYTWIFSSAS
jgi:thioredoxin reductase/Pyruvate/2-oxoacid:ferredoxin oxidoreductase delta subunit